MALNSVSPVSSATSGQAHINQQDFLKILLTQLNAQDPLKPMDNTAFVAQLAQFSQLAQTQELTASVNQLLAVQTAVQSVGLLGHVVSVVNGGGTATGTVTDISVSGNSPVLTIHPTTGQDISGVALKQVFDIR
ncbi:flagellar hook capping FlgD N-terminal domain-containing protein [Undibacterium sp. TS12]|uniref:flagellar hook assembly protein FlgD n=1 Tax=Undibacterium sp. TS12 TaxID=2908202 RepID=UPI001F4D03C8|nr:flagellar hook capping FlgD N-terminal domain-containing protein [Undibacterium sp. TS12]MCH8618750.1 flagellar hook capping protein [Undibacterium sp. TS12]